MELNENNYKEVLNALRLPEYWENRLRSKEQKCNSNTLRILDHLGENISGTAISHKLNSNNNSVRKHARSVFMKFSSQDAYKFLDNDFDADFNALDELRIHTSLRDKANAKPLPMLIRWVNLAQNENYKAFLIREIGYFKQVECADRLVDLYLDSDNVIIKKQIVETLGVLKYNDAVAVFIQDYEYNQQQIQLVIIEALGAIGGKAALEFLATIYQTTVNKETLIRILVNIYVLDPNGQIYSNIKAEASTEFENSMFAFVELMPFR